MLTFKRIICKGMNYWNIMNTGTLIIDISTIIIIGTTLYNMCSVGSKNYESWGTI